MAVEITVNMITFAQSYNFDMESPATLLRYVYKLRRVSTAMGEVMSVQLSTVKILLIKRPNIISVVFAPNETNVAPMTNSVAATCSPAYNLVKCFQ
jgi:hypothetical protein